MQAEMLISTYDGDWPQFRVMIHQLVRHWRGHRRVRVLVNQSHHLNHTQHVAQCRAWCDDQFDASWSWSVDDMARPYTSGTREQAINKLCAGRDSEWAWQTVWDAKDWIMRDMDESAFVTDQGLLRTQWEPTDQLHVDRYPWLRAVTPNLDCTVIHNLTPWIQHRDTVCTYLDRYREVIADIESDHWHPDGGPDSAGYNAWAHEHLDYEPRHHLGFLSAGVWTHQTDQGAREQVAIMKQSEQPIWKSSRKLPQLLKYSGDIMRWFGVDQRITDQFLSS